MPSLIRPEPIMKPLSRRQLCLIPLALLGTLAVFQPMAEPRSRAEHLDNDTFPPGWQPASPREEIRPDFSFNHKGGPKKDGSLNITADDREGLHGWWQKTIPITGGRYYRFQALRKVHDVMVPRRSAVV